MVNYIFKYLFIFVILIGLILTSCDMPYADESGYWIYSLSIINTDGTGLVHLTNENSTARYIAGIFTPDGTKIIGGNSDNLWSINIDGSNFMILNDSIGCNYGLTLSPDGEKIAHSYQTSPVLHIYPDLYISDIDGSNPQNITNTPTISETKPQFSTDGNFILFFKVVFTDLNNLVHSICYRDIEGTFENEIISITGESGYVFCHAVWLSEDKIIYTFWGDPNGIYSINIDGTENKLLYEEHVGGISICDDGSKFVFCYNWHIWSMNSDGTELTDLGEGYSPIISPNGEKIIFSENNDALLIMNVNGSNRFMLEETRPSRYHNFSWNSEKIVFTDSEFFQGDY